jgi:hypothetical protein
MQKMNVWTQKNVLCLKLCEYSETDHKDGIDHLCEKQGAVAFINYLTANGYAPLHLAALKGSRRAAEALIAHGADISLKSEHGTDAIQLALSGGHLELSSWLREQLLLQQLQPSGTRSLRSRRSATPVNERPLSSRTGGTNRSNPRAGGGGEERELNPRVSVPYKERYSGVVDDVMLGQG